MSKDEETATHYVFRVDPLGNQYQVGLAWVREDGKDFDIDLDTPVGTGPLVMAEKEGVIFEMKVDFPPGYRSRENTGRPKSMDVPGGKKKEGRILRYDPTVRQGAKKAD